MTGSAWAALPLLLAAGAALAQAAPEKELTREELIEQLTGEKPEAAPAPAAASTNKGFRISGNVAPVAAVVTPGRITQVTFDPLSGQTAELAATAAIIQDEAGQPLLVAGQPYIDEMGGFVRLWDARAGRVRITPDGATPMWVRCDDLKPMSIACRLILRVEGTNTLHVTFPRPTMRAAAGASPSRIVGGGAGMSDEVRGAVARGLPVCPGDPRCPRG